MQLDFVNLFVKSYFVLQIPVFVCFCFFVVVVFYLREIGQKSSEELAREGSGVKAFASFLSEVSALVPELMIPNISVLITHLEGEV